MNNPRLAHDSSSHLRGPANRTSRLLLVLTALSVGGLAIVAGAISFAHMRELAAHHGQVGWKAYASLSASTAWRSSPASTSWRSDVPGGPPAGFRGSR
ncbi:DUF2637 domain-containing protein [Krasilnikovia sp. M28-CT-15]|uniref:DUF2637 domain-containing protein n=1 Tax=Krasilnikovia sp. M28-CT-15 TaxID=3373540 RepID=UPI00399D459C